MQEHTNPITKDWSIIRLMAILNLPKKRIVQLLDNDQIYFDYGELCIKNISGLNNYMIVRPMTKTHKLEMHIYV